MTIKDEILSMEAGLATIQRKPSWLCDRAGVSTATWRRLRDGGGTTVETWDKLRSAYAAAMKGK